MKDLLFSTFITSKEVLNWELHKQTLSMALVDVAYAQWLEEDGDLAEYHADCWTGYIEVRPFGYAVWLETEDNTKARLSIPYEMTERARELMAELRSINKEINSLGLDEMPVIAYLDAESAGIMEELGDEYIALLVDAGLVKPLVEEAE